MRYRVCVTVDTRSFEHQAFVTADSRIRDRGSDDRRWNSGGQRWGLLFFT